jgi:hypothetical protein
LWKSACGISNGAACSVSQYRLGGGCSLRQQQLLWAVVHECLAGAERPICLLLPQLALKDLQRQGEELRKEQFRQGQALYTLRQRERELINDITGGRRCDVPAGCSAAPSTGFAPGALGHIIWLPLLHLAH